MTPRWLALSAGVPLGRLLGTSLRLSPVWFAVLVLVTALYSGLATRLVPGADRLGAHLIAGALAVLLLVSVLVHALGHLTTCRLAGVAVHAVVLSLPGASVEHDPPGSPPRLAAVAAGGPAASLALALLCVAFAERSADDGVPAALLGAAAAINLVITACTLLPGLPMDGGELVRAAVWAWSGSPETGRRAASRTGRVLAVGIAASALVTARFDDPAGSAVVLVAAWLVAAYVWHGAGSRPRRAASESVAVRGIWTWLVIGALSVAGMLLVRAFVVQSLVVASGSMDATLRTGDHIVVDKLSYLAGDIRRGDIVVMRRPAGADVPEDVLVKRVIGLPGDRLEAREGRLVRNGVAVEEPYLRAGCADDTAGLTTLVVPDRQVYVLGDNRCDSLDSRSFGPVDQALLDGRALVVIWPLDRVGAIPR